MRVVSQAPSLLFRYGGQRICDRSTEPSMLNLSFLWVVGAGAFCV